MRKKFIPAFLIATFLSSNSEAGDNHKNDSSATKELITMGDFVRIMTIGESFPPLAINNLTIENPEILPQIMLTCKEFNSQTQELWEATSFIYKNSRFSVKNILDSTINGMKSQIQNGTQAIKEIYNNFFALHENSEKLYKYLFSTLVFKGNYKELNGIRSDEVEELLRSVYKEIRATVIKHKKMPYDLAIEQKMNLIPKENLNFSYFELFKKSYKCYKFTTIGVDFLKNLEGCMKNLLTCSRLPNNNSHTLIGNKKGYNKDSFVFSNTSANSKYLDHQEFFKIEKYQKLMYSLYKLVLVSNKNFHDCCLVLNNKDRSMMQKIPVHFETLADDIVNGHMEAQQLFDDLSIGWDKYVNQSCHEAILLDYYLQIG